MARKRSRSPLLRKGGFGQRCRRSSNWDTARDLYSESCDEQVGGRKSNVATRTAWLPPGCVLKACVPLASEPDEPVPVIDFRNIAQQQLLEQNHQRSTKSDEEVEPFVSHSGNCDVLSRTIRSMEGRLANHGILAAPSTILAKSCKLSKSVGAAEDESFYKVGDEMDDFIDDSLLEDLNADDMQLDNSHLHTRDQGTSDGSTAGDVARTISFDPYGARLELWDDSITGTSQQSESDSDCSLERAAAPQLGICPWRERLPAMIQELVWISEDPSEGDTATTANNSIGDLLLAFDDYCSAVESSDGRNHSLLEACRLLQCNLPTLVRPLSQRGCWKAPVVAKIPNDSTTFRCGDKETRLFPMTMEEEVAWAHFTWRLVRFAMPGLRKSTFVSQWLDAATQHQQKYEVRARTLWAQHAREVLSVEECQTLEAITKQTATKRHIFACRQLVGTLLTIVNGLWQRYVRRRFWQAQRKTQSLDASTDVNFIQLRRGTATGFAYFAMNRLGDEMHVKIPLQFLTKHLHAQKVKKSSKFPLQLPIDIVAQINDARFHGSLRSVHDFHSQKVVMRARGGIPKQFNSLQKAAEWVCRWHPCPPQTIVNSLNGAGGGWKFFSVVRGQKTLRLSWILRHGEKLKCSVFRNPKDTGLCPTLPSLGLMNSQYRLRKEKNDLLSLLQPGQWLSCKYFGEAAKAMRYYNAYVLDVCRDEETGVCTQLKVRWFNGEVEDGVTPSRLAPVYRYAVGDSVAVYDREQWWQGTVTRIVENGGEFNERLYDVSLGAHSVTVKLDRLRREHDTTRQTPAQVQRGDLNSSNAFANSKTKSAHTTTPRSAARTRTIDQNSIATHKDIGTANEVYAKPAGKGLNRVTPSCSAVSSSSVALESFVRHKEAQSPPRCGLRPLSNSASSSNASLRGSVRYRKHAQSPQKCTPTTVGNATSSSGGVVCSRLRIKTEVRSLPKSGQTAVGSSASAIVGGPVCRKESAQSPPRPEQATVRRESFQKGQRCRVKIRNKWIFASVVEDLGSQVMFQQAGQTLLVDRSDVEALLKASERAVIDVNELEGMSCVDLD